MSEEEIIEKYHHFKIKTADGIELDLIETKYYKELLDLYKQTKKELNSLKEIEQLHKEENGKLRVEFEKLYEDNLTLANELKQEKEKNKELETINKMQQYRINVIDERELISKDKIRDMMIYREFELQQEYKEFEEDVEWRTYKKILEENNE